MKWMLLVLFFHDKVYGAGMSTEHIIFSTQAQCESAATIIRTKFGGGVWEYVDTLCMTVPEDTK